MARLVRFKSWHTAGLSGLISAGCIVSAYAVTAQEAPQPERATACRALLGKEDDGFSIEHVELVPAGPAPSSDGSGVIDAKGAALPEHCLIQGTLNSRIGHGGRKFGIGIDVRLPTLWNGRFAFHGGGGMDGRLAPAIGDIYGSVNPPALARGFAVASTDGGHRGDWTDATFGVDQQARIDYAYNALDKATLKAKELVRAYYGSAPRYSYMLGCSNGGRQGLIAAQKLPLYFDGIVSGDPSIGFSRIAIDQMWNLEVLGRISPKDAEGRPIISRAFSDGNLKLVKDRVLKQCDALDGLKDGIIHHWQGCDFEPGELICKTGESGDCLSKQQVTALRDLYRGPRKSDGTSIYGPFNYDTGIASPIWRAMRLGKSGTGELDAADANLGLSQFRHYQLTPADPAFDPFVGADYDDLLKRVRFTGAMGDADSPFLGSFLRRGKMIVYNGLSDQGMASSELVRWYEAAQGVNGISTRDSLRLFLVPGMMHCDGGEATDRFDMLQAIMDWVEQGKAPDRIEATSQALPGVSRPLCPHPLYARYRGGNEKSSSSFECVK